MIRLTRPLAISAFVLGGIVLGAGVEHAAIAADQPNMNAALNNLTAARSYLQRATADKAGHRIAAMRYVDQAIREVNLGIQAGKR